MLFSNKLYRFSVFPCIFLCQPLWLTTVSSPVRLDKNYETKLYGIGNLASTLCCSSSGYMQLKFNILTYGVLVRTMAYWPFGPTNMYR